MRNLIICVMSAIILAPVTQGEPSDFDNFNPYVSLDPSQVQSAQSCITLGHDGQCIP